MQNLASLRIYGAVLLALFLVIIIMNTMTVHQQQRDLAQQRKQQMSDKMHSKHKPRNKHHPFKQRHGSRNIYSTGGLDEDTNNNDNQLDTTDVGDAMDQYFENQQKQALIKRQQQALMKLRRKKLALLNDDGDNDDDSESEAKAITTAPPTTEAPPLGFFGRLASFFGLSSSSDTTNNNSSTSSSAKTTEYLNISEDDLRAHHHKKKHATFLKPNGDLVSSSSSDVDGGSDNEDDQEEDGMKKRKYQLLDSSSYGNNNNNNYNGYDETDKLKEQLNKLREEHDELQRQMDEQYIIKKRKGKKYAGKDDEDQQAEETNNKNGINIKINLNGGNNDDGDDEDDEYGHHHHHHKRGKHHHNHPRDFDKNHRTFDAGDLNEQNYEHGNKDLDPEDAQILEQANRLVSKGKRGRGNNNEENDGDATNNNNDNEDTEEEFDEEGCPGVPAEDGLPFTPYQKLVQEGRIYEPKFAYVTYITSAEFALPAAVLMFSIANTGSQYARVICVSKDISQRDRALLGLFAQIIEIGKIPSPLYVENARYRDTFTKLRMWQLEMFTKALYVDTDVVIKKNIDVLFDLDEWSVPMDAENDRYSTGMMLIAPSWKTFAAMMYDLNTTQVSMELPDLLFLKEFFERRGSTTGLKLSDVPALKSSNGGATGDAAGNNNNNNAVSGNGGNWAWRNGRWTYVSSGGGGYSSPSSTSTSARGIINIIPRWFQVYHIEFGSQYHSYLTHRVQKLQIYDPRIYGIHYPGNGKPWNDMGKKLKKFAKYLCHPEQAEARVRWRYQPEFIWYIYYSMMKRALKKIEHGIVGSPIFESERGKDIILNDYVKEQEKKRKEEEAWNQNIYGNNNNNYYANNNYNYNGANNRQDSTNNNNYNYNTNNRFANQQNNNNNNPVGDVAAPECFDCPKFTASACLVWNLTRRAPPGIVLFDDDLPSATLDGENNNDNDIVTSTTIVLSSGSSSAASGSLSEESLRQERMKKLYEKFYGKGAKKAVAKKGSAASGSGSSAAVLALDSPSSTTTRNYYTWNNDFASSTSTSTVAPSSPSSSNANNDDPNTQPQTFDDYTLTSQARPMMDLSTLDPLVLSLPQRTGLEGKSWEKQERYTWIVSWCTRTMFRQPADDRCGENAFVSQYSKGTCRTNFYAKFSIHRFGTVPKLLVIDNSTTTTTTEPPSSTTTATNDAASSSSASSLSSTSIESNTTSKKSKKRLRQRQNPVIVHRKQHLIAVPEYQQGEGVVIRSAVVLDNPKRTKWVDVVIRCDWSMKSESAADFDLDHPLFSSTKSYFAVLVDTVREASKEHRYRIFLKSRCACRGGCGLAKLWNETFETADESAAMRMSVKDEWVRNVTGLEPSIDELFPTTTSSITTKATKKKSKKGSSTKKKIKKSNSTLSANSSDASASLSSASNSNNFDGDDYDYTSAPVDDEDDESSVSTTTTTEAPSTSSKSSSPPRTTKAIENQTAEERARVRQVLAQASELAWSRFSLASTLSTCLGASNEYTCSYYGNSAFGRCQWVKEPSQKELSDAGLGDFESGQRQETLPPSTCLPKFNQSWILVASKSQKVQCNCTHVGGDADHSYTLDECFAKASEAGANVVNYNPSMTTETDGLPLEWQRVVNQEANFTKMRRERKLSAFANDQNGNSNNNIKSDDEDQMKSPKILSRADRAKLARKRRAEAAKRAQLYPPTTTTGSSLVYSAYNNYNFNNNKPTTGCFYKRCPQSAILKEKVPLKKLKKEDESNNGGYHVFIKNIFFVNATLSNKMLLL